MHLVGAFDPKKIEIRSLPQWGSVSNSLGLDNPPVYRLEQTPMDPTFNRLIDDLRIWDRPLTQNEVNLVRSRDKT